MRRAWPALAALLVLLCGCSGIREPVTQATEVTTTAALTTTASPTTQPEADTAAQAALALVEGWFQEPNSRLFWAEGTVEVEGEHCTQIRVFSRRSVNADLFDYQLMALFAIGEQGTSRYYLSMSDEGDSRWQRFQNDPWFACADAPDGKYRIESAGMDMDGPSGAHALKYINLVSLESGEVLWQDAGYLWNAFLWSPDSRYVAISRCGRTWAETFVVDSETLEAIELPWIDDLMELEPALSAPATQRADPYFFPLSWEDDQTLVVSAQWWTVDDKMLYLSFGHNLITGHTTIISFEEKQEG